MSNFKVELREINGEMIKVKVYAKSARKYTTKQMFLHERGLLEQTIKEAEEINESLIPFELRYLLKNAK